MKSFKLALLASALSLAGMAAAQAADISEPVPVPETPQEYAAMGWYLRGDIGWSFLEWSGGDDDSALVVGGGVGYRWSENMRSDLRVDWAGDYDTGDNGDLNTTTVLGNLYFDWANESAFTPYLGAGVGYGWVNASGDGDDDDGFAYALMAGVSVKLADTISLDTGYRFRDVLISGPDPYEHQIMTGLRFEF